MITDGNHYFLQRNISRLATGNLVKHQQLKRPQENLVPNGGPNLNTCTQIN
jgi:hypothetical protein